MATYLGDLNAALHELMARHADVICIGEDLVDPYGGAFKVSKGLSTAFPGRVLSTPISEAAIVGMTSGMALRGMRPVAEIMFGDFLGLCMDQLLNHLAKFQRMYGLKTSPCAVIRTPMGGGRGYGPTHSQSIEKHFLGIPGLDVVAPSHCHSPGSMLKNILEGTQRPTLFIENKLLYGQTLETTASSRRRELIDPLGNAVVELRNYDDVAPDVTIIAYGGMSRLLLPLLHSLENDEICVKLVIPATLSPVPRAPIAQAIADATRVLIVEEGAAGFTWGSEIACLVYELIGRRLTKPVKQLSSASDIIPNAKHLEDEMLVSSSKIEQAIDELLG